MLYSRRSYLFLVSLFACPLTGCSKGAPLSEETVRVFAASSLEGSFRKLARAFEATHPRARVQLTFAGSQVLRLQIEQGAQADVFASADETHLRALAAQGLARRPEPLAASELVVITPTRASVPHTFRQLPDAQRIVLGAKTVPVGKYSREVFQRAGASWGSDFSDAVMARVVSHESNVRLVRAKVELGEADAALVYRTEVPGSKKVRVVEIPAEFNVSARYFIALVLRKSENARGKRFIEFALSEKGQKILAEAGFTTGGPS